MRRKKARRLTFNRKYCLAATIHHALRPQEFIALPMKKTLVIGATPNPARYAYLAVMRLRQYGHEVVPVGIRKGSVDGVEIQHGTPDIKDLDTVTIYLNPQRQQAYYDYILSLKPRRIIFNPGAENPELSKLARENGIETEEACTLVMLSIGVY